MPVAPRPSSLPVSPVASDPAPTSGAQTVAESIDPTIGATQVTGATVPFDVTLGPPDGVTKTSVNDGKTVTLPTISAATVPKVDGLDVADAGEDAEIEVVHAYVGDFRQGSRVTFADFGEGVDFDRLFSLGAIKVIKEGAEPPVFSGKQTRARKSKSV